MQSKDRGAEEYREVFYENLCPKGFRKRLDEMPIAYLPLGTLEWHGPHLPLGADGIQSKGLFKIMAEEVGGLFCRLFLWGRTGYSRTAAGNIMEWILTRGER